MSTNVTAVVPGLAERKLHVATKLSKSLVDQLEEFERELRDMPLDREQLRGRVDELVMLACVVLDELGELGELELP